MLRVKKVAIHRGMLQESIRKKGKGGSLLHFVVKIGFPLNLKNWWGFVPQKLKSSNKWNGLGDLRGLIPKLRGLRDKKSSQNGLRTVNTPSNPCTYKQGVRRIALALQLALAYPINIHHYIESLYEKYPTIFSLTSVSDYVNVITMWTSRKYLQAHARFYSSCSFSRFVSNFKEWQGAMSFRCILNFVIKTKRLKHRYCIRFCAKLEENQAESIHKIHKVFGVDSTMNTQIKMFCSRFKDGHEFVESKQHLNNHLQA